VTGITEGFGSVTYDPFMLFIFWSEPMNEPTQIDLTLPEPFTPPADTLTNGSEKWDKPAAHPCGMNLPYFVREMTYEYPGYTILELHNEDGGEIVTIGDLGLQVWKSFADHAKGLGPLRVAPPSPDWPLAGWKVVARWCDQTGGMTMVDQFVFENGYHLSFTSECAVIYKDSTHYVEDDCGGDFVCFVDIAEGF
jgi:hypothetical protein